MSNHLQKLSGVFAPVVTPFRNGELARDDLRYNLRKLGTTGLAGYLALGSNGEFRSLSDEEQFRALEVFAEEKGDKTVMVGTARESTKHTLEITKRVADMGFGYASVLTPSYFAKQMNDTVLTGYFEAVADASPIPVLLYNAPGFAGGVQLSAKAVKKLAAHPNIVGMKDSSSAGPDKFLTLLDHAPDFHVLAGSANFFYASLHLGAAGGIISLANALPEPCCELYRLFLAGEYDRALDLHFKLSRLNGSVSGMYGVAGVKAAMDLAGFRGGEPRRPLVPVSETDRETIRQKIEAEGF
ncbi:MAG: dihydrodipicolinate synthase family protein [Candidatus Latescibacterota bacterium]